MILRLLYLLALLLGPTARLRAPECTLHEPAAHHLAAARAVAYAYQLDPALLLAIARHESCFDNRVVTGRCSGVMQTMGVPPSTLLQGYERGATEIQQWLRASRGSLRLALSGYSGGWRVWRNCRDGGDCGYADVFLRWTRRMRYGME